MYHQIEFLEVNMAILPQHDPYLRHVDGTFFEKRRHIKFYYTHKCICVNEYDYCGF